MPALIVCVAKEKRLRKKDKIFKGTCYITKCVIMQINEYATTHGLHVYNIGAQFHCFLRPIIIADNGASWKHLRMM